MTHGAELDEAFEFIGDIHQLKCPLCLDEVDPYDETKPLLQCKNCKKLIHSECHEACRATGENYECCARPDFEPVDSSLRVHHIQEPRCPICDEDIDHTGDRELLMCKNCGMMTHSECHEPQETRFACCAQPSWEPVDMMIHGIWRSDEN